MDEDKIRHTYALLARPENSVSSIAKLLGVSRNTLYKYVPELAAGRDSLVPNARTALPESRCPPSSFGSRTVKQLRCPALLGRTPLHHWCWIHQRVPVTSKPPAVVAMPRTTP